MGLTYRPPIPVTERILAMGTGGTGKTDAILTVARALKDDRFFVLDTEQDSYTRMLYTDYVDVQQHGNVVVEGLWDADEWDDYLSVIAKFKASNPTRDDWLVIDNLTPSWQAVQSWYTGAAFGQDIDEYFLQRKKEQERAKQLKKEGKEGKGGGPLIGGEYGVDWQVINKQYAKLYKEIMTWPGHVYLTCEVAKIGKDVTDRETLDVFGPHGVQPKGQGKLPHVPHTILLFKMDREGKHYLTTVKDRGRRDCVYESVSMQGGDGQWHGAFWDVYMKGVAGWKIAKTG